VAKRLARTAGQLLGFAPASLHPTYNLRPQADAMTDPCQSADCRAVLPGSSLPIPMLSRKNGSKRRIRR